MLVTIDTLKKTQAALGHKWFDDQINMIAVRSKLQVPDVFNDPFFMVYKEKGVEKLFSAVITTEPGVYYQKHLLNPKGCWVMMPAQMIDAYKAGLHQGKSDHRCLKSVGKIYGLRDDDKNGVAGDDKDAKAMWVDGTTVGANIHGAKKLIDLTEIISQNSAGCQVHARWSAKEEMMRIVDLYKNVNNGLITYSLVLEEKLVF